MKPQPTPPREAPDGRTARLTDGPIGRQLWQLALPMGVAVLTMMGFNMVDTMFVGRLGTIPLAAMAMTFPVVMVATSLGLGLGVSTSIAVSHAIGRKDEAAVKRLTTDGLSLALLLSVALFAAGALGIDPLLYLLEGDVPTHGPASAYLRVWLLGMPFVILPMAGSMALRATGDTLTPSLIMMFSSAVNLVLDPLLIFGWGPFPCMEIRGAALATVIARGLSLLVVLVILVWRERMLANPFVPLRQLLASWRLLMRNAVPIAMNNLMTPLQAGVLTRLSASVGTATVAGFGVACRVESFTLTGLFALQGVIGIFIGQNVGARRWGRVRGCLRSCERFALVYGLCGFVILLVAGRHVNALFNRDAAVIATAATYYLIVGVTLGIRGLYLVDSAVLNSLNRSADATALTILHGFAIGVPAAWLGSHLFGAAGLFGGIALANLVGGISTAAWARYRIAADARPGPAAH